MTNPSAIPKPPPTEHLLPKLVGWENPNMAPVQLTSLWIRACPMNTDKHKRNSTCSAWIDYIWKRFDCRVLRKSYQRLLKLQTDATVVLLLFVTASPIL